MSADSETISPPEPVVGAIISYIHKHAVPALVSGLGGAITIWFLAALTENAGQLLLIAPFGASCVLLYALPQSPLARPRNLIGGHFFSALVGLMVLTFIGDGVVAMGIGVGLAIATMQFTGTLHPPAGGNPLVVIMTGATWQFLLLPIISGTIILALAAWAYHRLISKRTYPG